jgi:hypothetical protein
MTRHLSMLTLAALMLAPALALAQDEAPSSEQARAAAHAQAQAAKAQAQAERARAQAERAQAQQEQNERAQSERAQAQAERAQAQAQAQAERGRARGPGRVEAGPGEGKVYAPGPFDSVVVDGAGQVRLVQGDRDEVFVPGDERAQEEVDVRLVGSRMKIDLPGGWKFWSNGNGAQVEVRVRHLNRLTMSGANDVVAPGPISGEQLTISMAGSGLARFDQLQVGRLNFEISGAGEGQLNGKVDQLRLAVSGKGRISAEQLRAGSADVSISGVANAVLWAVNNLRVQISGAGHVDYWGQPTVSKSISGFGSVDPRGAKE